MQAIGFPPVQPPFWQVSVCVQAFESWHEVPFGLGGWITGLASVPITPFAMKDWDRWEEGLTPDVASQVCITCQAIIEAGLASGRVGLEKNSSVLPVNIAQGLFTQLPDVKWVDASGLVDACRLVQSPQELVCTRRAASISDGMMRAAIQTAGPGINEQTVMAAIYDAMLQSGGTYPAFLPLVRSTRTLEHEHGTWSDNLLLNGDYLFLELSAVAGAIMRPWDAWCLSAKPRTRRSASTTCVRMQSSGPPNASVQGYRLGRSTAPGKRVSTRQG